MTERRWRVGAALVVVYVAVALVTQGRPLFDGFAPPTPYRWVKPPPEFTDNQPPESAERTIPVGDQGAEAANLSTTDAQIIVTLPQGAVAAHPPDTALLLKLTPLDAAGVAPLPAGLRAVSNAYHVPMAYQPSGTAVTQVNPAAIIALTAASDGDGLYYLPPGSQQWQLVDSRPFGATHGRTGAFKGPGYYVVTASPAVATTTTTSTSGAAAGGSGGLIVIVVILAVVGAIGGALTVRGRRQAAAAKRRRQRQRQRRGQGRDDRNRRSGRRP